METAEYDDQFRLKCLGFWSGCLSNASINLFTIKTSVSGSVSCRPAIYLHFHYLTLTSPYSPTQSNPKKSKCRFRECLYWVDLIRNVLGFFPGFLSQFKGSWYFSHPKKSYFFLKTHLSRRHLTTTAYAWSVVVKSSFQSKQF